MMIVYSLCTCAGFVICHVMVRVCCCCHSLPQGLNVCVRVCIHTCIPVHVRMCICKYEGIGVYVRKQREREREREREMTGQCPCGSCAPQPQPIWPRGLQRREGLASRCAGSARAAACTRPILFLFCLVLAGETERGMAWAKAPVQLELPHALALVCFGAPVFDT